MLEERWDDCVEIARDQIRDGAHLLDLCIDYVGRDGAADMRELAGRLATASTLPIVLDSTEPPVLEAGLEMLGGRARGQLGQLRGRRRPRLAVRPGDAARQGARRRGRRADHRRGGPGPHRGVEGARRRPARSATSPRTGGCASSDIIVDCLTFPIAHRPGGDPPRRHRDHRGDPRAQAALPATCRPRSGVSNVSFGLNPAARVVLNSVFLHECVKAGLDSAIVHAVEDPADGPDPGRAARGRARPGLRPPPRGLRPAAALPRALRGRRRQPIAKATGPRSWPRCRCPSGCERRIVDGERNGLEADLDEALADRPGRSRSSTTRCWPA